MNLPEEVETLRSKGWNVQEKEDHFLLTKKRYEVYIIFLISAVPALIAFYGFKLDPILSGAIGIGVGFFVPLILPKKRKIISKS